ncbi:DoxX family protein [Nocardia sp. NPDC057030]|uniref:DoxX family protein n=1 Tax=unclassified Nocardia TaxID=2637762 RepID=UPI00363F62BA
MVRVSWLHRLRTRLSVERLLVGMVFIYAGRRVFCDPEGPTAKLERVLPTTRFTAETSRTAVRANAAVMVIAGTTLGLGIAPRLSAYLLAGSLSPTNVVGHDFWSHTDPNDRATELSSFLSNLAITGGLLSVARTKSAASLDRQRHRASHPQVE